MASSLLKSTKGGSVDILVISDRNDFIGRVTTLLPMHTIMVEDGPYARSTFTHNNGPLTIVDGESVAISDYLNLLAAACKTPESVVLVIQQTDTINSKHTMSQMIGAVLLDKEFLSRIIPIAQAHLASLEKEH